MIQSGTKGEHLPPTAVMPDVVRELEVVICGDVRFDDKARALYATDASPYEIRPHGVVLPKHVDDIRHVVDIANRYGLAVLPRGGGTSLAGQTVAEAIVLDFSKYMTQVLELDLAAQTVKVEPGIVRDNLNTLLKPHALQFTPDISTTAQANVGGMVANNSAGTRSIKYGKSVDQVIAMTVMLADGSIVTLNELTDAELQVKLNQQSLEGEIYRTVHHVVNDHADEIEARYPKVMRRVGGYNLDEFTRGQPFNLAKLVSGSEGTLAIILDVTIKLYPVPKHKLLALVHFDSLEGALTAVKYVNEHGPSAVEILDDHLFNLGKQNPALAPLLSWLNGNPAAVLMVEFDGETEADMRAGLTAMQADVRVSQLAYYTYLATDAKEQEEVLEFRRGGLGIYATVKGDNKPVPFIEDSSIPVEHLPNYIPEVLAVCESYGVKAVIYAHASVGVIHIRPHLNLKDETGIQTFQAISEDVFKLVQKYGGSWSGEHGDGLIRSYQNKNLFGDVLYKDFQAIKHAFDPDNRLNPGKIVDAPAMTENLRYGTDYDTQTSQPISTYFDFSNDEGYLGAIEACTGVGKCRKTDTGTMCPSYMATRDEDHSTRGRANILREAISGRLPGGLTSKDVYEVLDLCLECKACKAECPSQVDMAKIKYEFLQHYYDDHGTPLSVQAIGSVAKLAPLAQKLAPLANAMLPLKSVRFLLDKVLKVDKRRVLPMYAEEDFATWFKRRQQTVETSAEPRPPVALFADTWTMYNEPEVGKAAVTVLEALGYAVELVSYGCCGRPQISKGLLKAVKPLAKKNVESLYPYVEQGVPVIGLEPSCVTAFTDDYQDLVPGEKTKAVGKHIKMIDQFLAKEWTQGKLKPEQVFHKNGTPMMLHGHCQQRASFGTSSTNALLTWISEDVHEVDSGCCGMAGSFGYGHHDVSMTIGEQRLFPAVREHCQHKDGAQGEVVACGFSCRHQIKDGTQVRAKHLVEVMAESLTDG
ncbi:MAG: FAD-linked oxidase C-terminal domain-containing protein [Deinococcota bacterium]